VGGEAVVDPGELRIAVSGYEPGMNLDLEVRHKDQTRKLTLKMAELPGDLPPQTLPPARSNAEPGQGQQHKVGRIELKVPEFKNEAWAYVPERYDPAVPHGVVVWLHGSSVPDAATLLAQWKPLCDAADLVLVAPKAGGGNGWQADEADYIEKLLGQVKAAYTVDPTRVVVFGRDTGASLALLSAFRSRELIRAAAVIDAGSMLPPPEIDPGHRLAIYLGTVKNSTQAPLVKMTLARLKAAKVPVTEKDLGKDARDLTPAEVAELVRWIDMLDRI
jgi:poly(3-hydroxybutyrate) depolymerase